MIARSWLSSIQNKIDSWTQDNQKTEEASHTFTFFWGGSSFFGSDEAEYDQKKIFRLWQYQIIRKPDEMLKRANTIVADPGIRERVGGEY